MMLLIMQCSPASRHFILGPNIHQTFQIRSDHYSVNSYGAPSLMRTVLEAQYKLMGPSLLHTEP
jgi:hypothetical protein